MYQFQISCQVIVSSFERIFVKALIIGQYKCMLHLLEFSEFLHVPILMKDLIADTILNWRFNNDN